jgi:hypothetical protein
VWPLVALRGDYAGGAQSPIALSVAAPGAEVAVVPESVRRGQVAEVTVIPSGDQQETAVPVTVPVQGLARNKRLPGHAP